MSELGISLNVYPPNFCLKRACKLLPDQYKPIEQAHFFRHKLCANTPMGYIAFCSSKEYENGKLWTAPIFSQGDEKIIVFWVIAIGWHGVLVLPSEVIDKLDFRKHESPSSYHKFIIHIRKEQSNLYIDHLDKHVDVSKWFYDKTAY